MVMHGIQGVVYDGLFQPETTFMTAWDGCIGIMAHSEVKAYPETWT